jgi:hypothetical protein
MLDREPTLVAAADPNRASGGKGIGNLLIAPAEEVGRTTGEIACRERLGGLLRYYYREAA